MPSPLRLIVFSALFVLGLSASTGPRADGFGARGAGTSAKPQLAAETQARLEGAALALLFSDTLVFTIDSPRTGIQYTYTYEPNGTWESISSAGKTSWGNWSIVGNRVDRDPSGGNVSVTHSYGLERREDGLFFVDSSLSVYAGVELGLAEPGILAQLDGENSKEPSLETVAPRVEQEREVQAASAEPLRPETAEASQTADDHAQHETQPAEPPTAESEQSRLKRELAALREQLALARNPSRTVDSGAHGMRQVGTPLIPDIDFGKYYALVIGINEYVSLPKLKTAVGDARTVAKTLQDLYGFSVTLLENPTRTEIIDAFDELRDTLSEADNLLIYYAGHGWLNRQTSAGYWLPVNAKPDRRSRWVSNATLTEALSGLLAKHVMVVADSCYSGTLTRSIKVPHRNETYLERIAEKRARVVLSSGGLEPVIDSGGGKHSVFAAQFLKALRENKGVLDGTRLFEKVRQTVILNADQTPEYSDIRKAGHEGGDFLFVRAD